MNNNSHANRYARFIPSEEIDRVAEWNFGAVDETVRAAVALAARVEAAEAAENSPAALQKMQEIRDAAHAAGVAEGRAAATREARQQMDDYVAGIGRERAERFEALIAQVDQALDAVQQGIAESVLEIACDIARQVLRRELALDPQAAMPVVREALAMVRADGRVATVRLDPQDLELVRGGMRDEPAAGQQVAWLADESVGPGGCLVECAGAVVDGRLPARWKQAVAALGCEEAWEQAAGLAQAAEPAESAAPVHSATLPEAATSVEAAASAEEPVDD